MVRRLRRPGSSMRSTPCEERQGPEDPSAGTDGGSPPRRQPDGPRGPPAEPSLLSLELPRALRMRPSTLRGHPQTWPVPAPRQPPHCLQRPCGHLCARPRGELPEPAALTQALSPPERAAEAKLGKPKKLLRQLQGFPHCVVSSRQLEWEPAPEALGPAPPGQDPGFPRGLPGGGTGAVPRTGVTLLCTRTNAHARGAWGRGPRGAHVGGWPPPSESRRQWQRAPCRGTLSPECPPGLGPSIHTASPTPVSPGPRGRRPAPAPAREHGWAASRLSGPV